MDRAPKSMKAVLFPREFEAFRAVPDGKALGAAWEANRPCVLANMAHAAYFQAADVADLMGRLGAAKTHGLDRRDTQAFLATWPDKAVLSFRGTEIDVLGDILSDLAVHKTDFRGARVHSGFLEKLETLWDDDLEARLDELGDARIPVWVTGHSLGGAIATLAGMRWPFQEVVTFGQPRVGSGLDDAFVAHGHVRYVNGLDSVPRIPPAIMGYEHHGEEVRLVDPDGPSARYDHSIVYYAEILQIAAD